MGESILEQNGIDLKIAKKDDSEQIVYLRSRAGRCVCRYCGQKLSLRKITYAAYDEAKIETYCEHCERLENGTEPEIWKLAAQYVDNMKYDHFPNFDDSIAKRRMNIATICDVFSWAYRCVGILSDKGFKDGIEINFNDLEGNLLISDTALSLLEEGEG